MRRPGGAAGPSSLRRCGRPGPGGPGSGPSATGVRIGVRGRLQSLGKLTAARSEILAGVSCHVFCIPRPRPRPRGAGRNLGERRLALAARTTKGRDDLPIRRGTDEPVPEPPGGPRGDRATRRHVDRRLLDRDRIQTGGLDPEELAVAGTRARRSTARASARWTPPASAHGVPRVATRRPGCAR